MPADFAAAGPAPEDPAAAVGAAESIGMALMVVLEALTPAERVVFVLHDVFALPFAEIAAVVDRSPAACRQLAASARRKVPSAQVRQARRGRHVELARRTPATPSRRSRSATASATWRATGCAPARCSPSTATTR